MSIGNTDPSLYVGDESYEPASEEDLKVLDGLAQCFAEAATDTAVKDAHYGRMLETGELFVIETSNSLARPDERSTVSVEIASSDTWHTEFGILFLPDDTIDDFPQYSSADELRKTIAIIDKFLGMRSDIGLSDDEVRILSFVQYTAIQLLLVPEEAETYVSGVEGDKIVFGEAQTLRDIVDSSGTPMLRRCHNIESLEDGSCVSVTSCSLEGEISEEVEIGEYKLLIEFVYPGGKHIYYGVDFNGRQWLYAPRPGNTDELDDTPIKGEVSTLTNALIEASTIQFTKQS